MIKQNINYPCNPRNPQESAKSVNTALIGCGYWGKNLIRVFNQFGVLKIICDLDKKVLNERKREYSNLQITTDFSEILNDKSIKAVIISTPVTTHYRLAKKVLLSGKDVFVEKPLALKVEEGEELVKLAKKKKLILMVGHLLLYHPAIVKLKELIKKGEVGEIRYIWSNRLNFGKLRREENVLWSFAPHDISVIIDILGMPQKVLAKGKSYLQKDIPDTTLSILEFRKNQTAHVFVSWLNPFKEQKLSVIGSKKMVVFNGISNELMAYSHQINWTKDKGPKAIKAKGKAIKFSSAEPLVKEVEHFLECIKNRKIPQTGGEEGLRVLRILNSCEESIIKGNFIKI